MNHCGFKCVELFLEIKDMYTYIGALPGVLILKRSTYFEQWGHVLQ